MKASRTLDSKPVFSPEICLRGGACIMRSMPLRNLLKSCLVRYFMKYIFLMPIAGKGHIVLLDQTTKGTLEAQRAQCPLVEA